MASNIKGPGIYLAQFGADAAPFNSWNAITKWAAGHGFKGVQLPSWDSRLIDPKKAATSKTYVVRHLTGSYVTSLHIKDAEFRPTGRQGVYSGYQPWLKRGASARSATARGDPRHPGRVRAGLAHRAARGERSEAGRMAHRPRPRGRRRLHRRHRHACVPARQLCRRAAGQRAVRRAQHLRPWPPLRRQRPGDAALCRRA
ncbi:MAG TPA: hypothetical protein VGI48_06180 [Caldimonas sp.]|jgi:hypothetical protein